MKKKTFDIVIIVWLIIILILGVFVVFYIFDEKTKCVRDPINYYKDIMNDGKGVNCFCIEDLFDYKEE